MDNKKDLHILWTNGDPVTSQFMVMMYATNSMIRQWRDNVTVILWGAPAKLAVENETIRECIKVAQNVGVRFSACISCARQLGVIEELEALDIEVKPWGEPLTELMQNGSQLLTV